MDVYDAIIVGAGPAGSAAARVLAGAGASVLVLDRSEFPRDKLCGGAMTEKTMRLLARVFGLGREALAESGALVSVFHEFSINHLSEVLIQRELEYPLHFADRRLLDDQLLRLAGEAGAELRPGQGARACDVVAATVETESGEELRGRFLIGADGAAGVVRREFPHDKDYWRRYMAMGVEAVIENERFPQPPSMPVLHYGAVSCGYGWVFPHPERTVTGVCGLMRKNPDIKRRFHDYLEFLGVSGSNEVRPGAHMLPYGCFLERHAHGGTLLAGDAAGFVECLLGEGIYYALRSGEAAGHAVLQGLRGGSAGKAYMEGLKRDVLRELKATRAWRHFLYRYQKNMRPRPPVPTLLRLFSGPLVDMVQGRRSFFFGLGRDLE